MSKNQQSTAEAAEVSTKILFAGTSYPSSEGDWKGLFLRRLLEALARRRDMVLHAWLPPGPRPENVPSACLEGDAQWLELLMERGGIAHLLRRYPIRGALAASELLRRLRRTYRNSDMELFHVNWLQNALALPSDGRPALVTALGSDIQLLRVPLMKAALRSVFRDHPTVICPNGEWMVPILQRAFGDVAQVRCVPFGIDARWYSVERQLEMNPVPLWVCVSRLTAGKLGPLFEWTAPAFAHGRAELHLFGPMQEQIKLPSWVHWHGPASPDELRESWFPRAQGLITLSRHAEGRPQVMLEALAAGLPIVASRLPAHDDLLRDGNGGVLCDSAEATLAAIRALADSEANRTLGLRGRARMAAEIGTWDDCAGRYAALYCQLLGDR